MKPTILIVFGSPHARENFRNRQIIEAETVERRQLNVTEFPTFCIQLALVSSNFYGLRVDCIIEDESIHLVSDKYLAEWHKMKTYILKSKKDSAPPGG